jgi:hypothetical protein
LSVLVELRSRNERSIPDVLGDPEPPCAPLQILANLNLLSKAPSPIWLLRKRQGVEMRNDVVEIARSFMGTPFEHQGHLKGVGVDCAGFIAEVAKESGVLTDTEFEQNYRRQENGAEMLRLLRDYMEYVGGEPEIGDVLALCDERLAKPDIPRHLMILTEKEPYWKAIHASEHGVREHRLDLRFKQRIHSVWRLKEQ